MIKIAGIIMQFYDETGDFIKPNPKDIICKM